MTYDSPKQIRRRQNAANDKAARRRQPRTTRTFTDADWQSACDFHIERILHRISMGHAEAAGRHAEALAHCAVTRRALEIMRKDRGDFYPALATAKSELYDCEI